MFDLRVGVFFNRPLKLFDWLCTANDGRCGREAALHRRGPQLGNEGSPRHGPGETAERLVFLPEAKKTAEAECWLGYVSKTQM